MDWQKKRMRLLKAELVSFGLSLGLRNLSRQGDRFRKRCGMRKLMARILHPVDYWRYAEFGLLIDRLCAHLHGSLPVRLLELAGPKIGALFVSEKFPQADVLAVDRMSGSLEEWALLKQQLPDQGRRIRLLAADGRQLPFPDKAFDMAFSISAIEHFPGCGDIDASRELARCVRPGGTVMLTVPCALEYRETWLDRDVYGQRYQGVPLFWQRHYDEESMEDRIVRPGRWRLVERTYAGERWIPFERMARKALGHSLFEALGLLHPLAAEAFISYSSHRETLRRPGRHLSFAFMVLEKPAQDREGCDNRSSVGEEPIAGPSK